MRHFGGAIKLEEITGSVVARDRAACLQRHPAMPPGLQFEGDDCVGRGEGRGYIAKSFADDGGFGGMTGFEFAGRRIRGEGQWRDYARVEAGRWLDE